MGTDELALIFERRRPAISAAMRYLCVHGLARKVGEYRSPQGKPVPVWAATDIAATFAQRRESAQQQRNATGNTARVGVASLRSCSLLEVRA